MNETVKRVAGLVAILFAVVVSALLGWALFVEVPSDETAFGVLLAVAVVLLAVRFAVHAVDSALHPPNVAEVEVRGPITRDGGGKVPMQTPSLSADDIVEQIREADEHKHVRGLLLKLNTPGGEVVPSEDIRLAAEEFDGPTIAYATDVCASGGYWIASGCDAIYAREASIVGSIGVIGSRLNATELADNLGVSYERFAAGAYKDAGLPLKEMSDDERAYLQRIVDDYYENFVERVADGRDLDVDDVRETEARVYLGEDALDLGLVDNLGTRDDVEQRLETDLGVDELSVQEFEPEHGLAARLTGNAERVAYALGAGVASAFGDDAQEFTFRL